MINDDVMPILQRIFGNSISHIDQYCLAVEIINEISRVEKNLVLNLTDIHLSTNLTDLLGHGISFVPIRGRIRDTLDRTTVLEKFVASLHSRLLRMETGCQVYSNQPFSVDVVKLTLRKFKLAPGVNRQAAYLDHQMAINALKPKLLTALSHTHPFTYPLPNISTPQHVEVTNLISMIKEGKCVMRKADKSAQIVLMTKSQYIAGCLRLLNDTVNYLCVPVNLFRRTAARTITIVKKYRNLLFSDDIADKLLLTVRAPVIRQFYALPKTHKPIAKWVDGIPPFRPIVSDLRSETAVFGYLIAQVLRPYFEAIPSYIKNAYTLKASLVQLPFIDEDYILFVSDIDNLYPNIPIVECLQRIKKLLCASVPLHCLVLELLELQLSNNYFEFDGKTFLQLRGIPMGKAWAPAVASLYLCEWEKGILAQMTEPPLFYGRYIDDVLAIVRRSCLPLLNDLMNTSDPNIRLGTAEHGSSVNFLDLTVSIAERKLTFKTFHKPSSLLVTIHEDSFHTQHCKRNTVLSQLIRRYRLHSDVYDFQKSASIYLCLMHVIRAYPIKTIIRIWKEFLRRVITNGQNTQQVVSRQQPALFVIPFGYDLTMLRHATNLFTDEMGAGVSNKHTLIAYARSGHRNVCRLLFRY